MFRFLKTQLHQIRTGGVATALNKARTLLILCVLGPCVMIVRALRPIKLIRFGAISGRRIGHLAIEPDLHLLLRAAGVHPPGSLDLLYYLEPVANRQLQRMWSRAAGLHFWRVSSFLDRANRLVPGGDAHSIRLYEWWWEPAGQPGPPVLRLSMRSPSRLAFTGEEEQRGQSELRKIGLADGAPFVCFNARDARYLEAMQPSTDWRYHDYRDANIQHYLPAIDELTRRGYWGIRMGAIVKDALHSQNPRIVDYATCARTDFLDIFLTAKCRFFINDTSGLMSVPMVFRRPMVLVNVVPIAAFGPYNFEDRGLFIPKKLRLRKAGRFLTFRETLGSEIGGYFRAEDYDRAGIDVVENTPEEILAVTMEMAERLDGNWQARADDDELQERFLQILGDCGLKDSGPCRIGAAFLREHRALLQ